jgi:hypothetical protein
MKKIHKSKLKVGSYFGDSGQIITKIAYGCCMHTTAQCRCDESEAATFVYFLYEPDEKGMVDVIKHPGIKGRKAIKAIGG